MPTKKKTSDSPATKKDMQQLEQNTKKDLQQLESKLGNKIDSVRSELKAEIKEFKNEILNGQDEIIKKLDDMRTEKLMLVAQNRRHDDTITNHEERIIRLEKKVLV